MAYTIFRENEYQYICDEYSDLILIDTTYVLVGSFAKVINEHSTYILNNNKIWMLWEDDLSDNDIASVNEAKDYLNLGGDND